MGRSVVVCPIIAPATSSREEESLSPAGTKRFPGPGCLLCLGPSPAWPDVSVCIRLKVSGPQRSKDLLNWVLVVPRYLPPVQFVNTVSLGGEGSLLPWDTEGYQAGYLG